MNSLRRFYQPLKKTPSKSPKAYFLDEDGNSKYPHKMTLEDNQLLEQAKKLPMSSEMDPVPHFNIQAERAQGNKLLEEGNNRDMSDEDYRAGRKLRRTRKRVIGRRKTKRLAPKRRKAAKRKTARK